MWERYNQNSKTQKDYVILLMFFASLSFSLRPQRSAFLDKVCFDSQLLVEECSIKTHTHTIVQNEEKNE